MALIVSTKRRPIFRNHRHIHCFGKRHWSRWRRSINGKTQTIGIFGSKRCSQYLLKLCFSCQQSEKQFCVMCLVLYHKKCCSNPKLFFHWSSCSLLNTGDRPFFGILNSSYLICVNNVVLGTVYLVAAWPSVSF